MASQEGSPFVKRQQGAEGPGGSRREHLTESSIPHTKKQPRRRSIGGGNAKWMGASQKNQCHCRWEGKKNQKQNGSPEKKNAEQGSLVRALRRTTTRSENGGPTGKQLPTARKMAAL